MAAQRARDGKGHRAYRRQADSLRRRTKNDDLPCGYGSPTGEGCGQHIDTTLPAGHRMSFTADHPYALANGGRLVGQVLVPMHLSCNSRKGDHAPVEIWAAS